MRALLCVLLAACSSGAPLTATVVEVRGQATVDGEELSPGDVLGEGDEVQVAQGRVELDVPGVGRLRVFASTKLQLQKTDGDTFSVKLAAGKVWALVGKLQGHAFEVQSETAVAGVRGTEFVVEEQEGEAEVRVASGEVEVANKNDRGNKRRIGAGHKTRVRKRAAPSEPEAYDVERDRAHWNELAQAGREIKEGFKKGGRAIRDGGRSFGRKVRDLFR